MRAGETVAVFGTGGLGIHAVALSRSLGAGRIIALDIDDGALANADAYGADEIVNLRKVKNPGKTLKEVSGGVDVLLDFSGRAENVAESVRAMNRGGRMVLVGIGRSALNFAMPFLLIERQITVAGSYGSDRRALPELIELVSSGRLDLRRSVTSVHKLEEANDCLHALEERRGNPIRFVLEP
jgi:propanol-preferring alcohol dehydrogenase